MNTLTMKVLVGTGYGLRFTESPRWHEDRLWFLDIHDSAIKAVDLEGRLETVLDLPFKPNGLGFCRDGSALLSDAVNLKGHRWDRTTLHPALDLSETGVFCCSDGLVDGADRMYIGDIGYDFLAPDAQPTATGVISRIDPDGTVRKVADGLAFPNGMVITPDGKTLIVAETVEFCLTAYDILPDGDLANRRVFAQLPDGVQPDGICLDAEGAVWLANPAGNPAILRVREGGEVTDQVNLDTHAYAVMLGGPERRHLFVSTSASHEPAEIAQNPSAAILIAEVQVAGAGLP